jgi:hypothetical protein
MPLSLVQRLLHSFTPRAAEVAESAPMQAQPPSRNPTRAWQRRLGAWLASTPAVGTGGSPLDDWQPSAARSAELNNARSAFATVLDDIHGVQSGGCLSSIRAARSLHELWHLRSEVFSLVSRNRSQAEATRRMAVLDLHFPRRARRGRLGGSGPREAHESVPPF